MAGSYADFDVAQMLNALQRFAIDVRLTSDGNAEDWTLYVYCEEFGEFHESGSLFRIVMKAFEPYLEKAKHERQELRDKLGCLLATKQE
ncbi:MULTISPECIES: hypothetical protein [unclassified Vibrio]|uniref:hypothetical protein n=1 Tax=unclassified Vibrio TaxID=2614977 RepID=UPI001481F1BA|nr:MULTISPECIES: hypothetical protein [unclassified Vibrio]EIU6870693.1 hypothetical protein [Vibrio parahaemolyticus]MDW1981947.1 hypothetical protein [Vibrio sp. Vb0304]NNN82186.1 hypothetical protein [Vibrio sp. 11-4(1)]